MSELLSLLSEYGFVRFVVDAAWQSTLIGGLAALALRHFARRPAVKSWIAVLACALCVVTPCATFAVRTAGLGVLPVGMAVEVAEVTDESNSIDRVQPESVSTDLVEIVEDAEESSNVTASESEAALVAAPTPDASATQSSSRAPHRINPGLVFSVLWGVAAIWFLLRLARSVWALSRICRDARQCDDAVVLQSSERAAALLRLRRTPEVLVSEQASCPAVVSWLRPKLIVPLLQRDLGEEHWVGVFAHEMAHVQRRDGWARLLTELAIVAMPWQPLLWWLRREYHESSEQACDDWAIFAGADPVDYASALTDWVPRQQPTLVLGIAGWPRLTRRRIERLLEDQTPVNPALGAVCRVGTIVFAMAAVIFIALIQQGTLYSAMADTPSAGLAKSNIEWPSDNLFGDGRLSHWNTARVLGFSPDSRTTISTSRDRTLMTWNTRTGKPIGKRNLPLAATGRWHDWPVDVRGRFSTDEIATPDGRSLVQSMANGDIRVIEIASGQFRTLEHRVRLPLKLAISSDGTTVAVLQSATKRQNAIAVIDLASGQLIQTIVRQSDREEDQIRPDRWRGFVLSSDGSLLATGRRERVSVFEISSGKELWHEQADRSDSGTGMAGVLCFSSDNTKLGSGGWVRNAATGDELASFRILPRIATAVSRSVASHVAFDRTGNLLALTNGSSVRIWDINANRQKWATTSRSGQSYSSVCFSPDGNLLAASAGNEIVLLEAETGQRTSASTVGRVESLAVSPTDSRFLLGLTTGQIESVEPGTMQRTRWDAHDLPVRQIAFSPNGQAAASATSRRLAFHDPKASRKRRHVDFEPRPRAMRQPSRLNPIGFSTDSAQLFSAPVKPDRSRNKLDRWSIDGKQLTSLEMTNAPPYFGLASTSRGELLALSRGSTGSLFVWNAATGKSVELERLLPRRGGRPQVAATRTSDKIAFGVRGEAFRVYVRSDDSYVDLKKGHRSGPLRALAFHPAGRILASAAEDGRVVLWDTTAKDKLASLKIGPRGGVITALSWTHDGKSFVARNANGTAAVHTLRTELLAKSDSDSAHPKRPGPAG